MVDSYHEDPINSPYTHANPMNIPPIKMLRTLNNPFDVYEMSTFINHVSAQQFSSGSRI